MSTVTCEPVGDHRANHDDLMILDTRGPLIYGYVVQNLTWQMGFWFVSIPLGLCTLMVFFFVPEVCRFSIIISNFLLE